MNDVIQESAWLVALIAPFFLVLRRKGFGFVVAVLLGWGAIGFANEHLRLSDFAGVAGDEIGTAAVFCGVWMCLGWGFMVAYCFFVLGLLVAWSAILRWSSRVCRAWKEWDRDQ